MAKLNGCGSILMLGLMGLPGPYMVVLLGNIFSCQMFKHLMTLVFLHILGPRLMNEFFMQQEQNSDCASATM